MKVKSLEYIDVLYTRYPDLEILDSSIKDAIMLLKSLFKHDGTVFICGNGGSAADAEHIVGELMKSFMKKRPVKSSTSMAIRRIVHNTTQGEYIANHLEEALPAISLVSNVALPTAFANDVASDMIFAQQFYALAKPNDVLWGISTSGNSQNVVNALCVAHAMGCKTLGLTGRDGGQMAQYLDVEIRAPHDSTPIIQEYHLPIYHTICQVIEEEMFD